MLSYHHLDLLLNLLLLRDCLTDLCLLMLPVLLHAFDQDLDLVVLGLDLQLKVFADLSLFLKLLILRIDLSPVLLVLVPDLLDLCLDELQHLVLVLYSLL